MYTISTVLQQPTKMPTSPETSEQPQTREVSPPLNHICDICGKGFRSGQSLGGHKSIHFRESKAIMSNATPISRRDPICCRVCGKDFLDKRLLFAHLTKTHSGYNSSSSSSTVSDEPMIDDGVDSGSSFDLAKSLPLPAAWPPTGKRKRRTAFGASSSDCSGSDEAAANLGLDACLKLSLVPYVPRPEADDFSGLVMLAHVCAEEASKNLFNYNKDYQKFESVANKRRRLNDADEGRWSVAAHYGYSCIDIDNDFRCKLCNKSFRSPQALGGHMSSHNRIKMNSADHDHDKVHSEYNSEQQLHPRYDCNVCKRKFSSFQALGGHKSRHCKDVNINSNSNSGDYIDVKDDKVPEPHQVQVNKCEKCKKVFTTYHALGGHTASHKEYKDVDRDQSSSADVSSGTAEVKNEPQTIYETVPHQCKTCFKIFPTGQALGGHQRLHYKGPTEVSAKPSQKNSARRLLEFDLNETPSLEDEDGPSMEFDLNETPSMEDEDGRTPSMEDEDGPSMEFELDLKL